MFRVSDLWYFLMCRSDKYFSVKMSDRVFCINDCPVYIVLFLNRIIKS